MKHLRSVFLFCLIVWVLGEILTRIFIPIEPSKITIDRSFEHPYIRTDWVPGFKTNYVIEGIGGQTGTMEFKINEFGFRSSSMKTASKPVGVYRIFFLGGSTTEEIYMPEEKSFPFLVEKKLYQAYPNWKFECINDGISGYLAADTLALLIHKVMYYEPDLVVVMLAINDLRYGTVPTYDPIRRTSYQKILYRPEFNEGTWKCIAKIIKKSHFIALIKWRLINRLFPPPDAPKYKTKLEEYNEWRRARREKPFTNISESRSLPDFSKYLEEIIFIAKGHGIRLIFMTEPFIYQKNLSSEIDEKLWMGYIDEADVNLSNEFLLREMNRFNDTTRKLSQKHGIELIDLEREMPKDLKHFYDDVHLTPLGAKRAADVIASYLVSQAEKLTNYSPSPKE